MKARAFAVQAHGSQLYGQRPYVYHLDQVASLLQDHGETAQAIGYLHDVLEDTPTRFEAVEAEFGALVAQCVQLLTDAPGATRKERKALTYQKLAAVQPEHHLALIAKTADRLANVRACLADSNTRLLGVYADEHPVFRASVYRPGLCDALWRELDGYFVA